MGLSFFLFDTEKKERNKKEKVSAHVTKLKKGGIYGTK